MGLCTWVKQGATVTVFAAEKFVPDPETNTLQCSSLIERGNRRNTLSVSPHHHRTRRMLSSGPNLSLSEKIQKPGCLNLDEGQPQDSSQLQPLKRSSFTFLGLDPFPRELSEHEAAQPLVCIAICIRHKNEMNFAD